MSALQDYWPIDQPIPIWESFAVNQVNEFEKIIRPTITRKTPLKVETSQRYRLTCLK
jgi:hypothetical protein